MIENSRIMDKNKKLQVVFLCIIFIQAFIIVSLADKFLPPKYFYDANTIRSVFPSLESASNSGLDYSFVNTAKFYFFFGIDQVSSGVVQGYICYLFVYLCLIYIFIKAKPILSFRTSLLILIWNTIFSIYLGQLSKDVIATIFITLSLSIIIKEKKFSVIIFALIISLYALSFRRYWFIYLYFIFLNNFILFNSTQNILLKNKWFKWFVYIFLILILFFLADIKGVFLTDSRVEVNMFRLQDSDASTLIENLLPNVNFITDFINWIYGLFVCFIPIPLISKLNLLSLCFVFWNLLNVYFFIKLKRFNGQTRTSNTFIFSIVLSLPLTQAIFEPDLGSFLRHELVVIPVFLYLLLKNDKTLLLAKRN